MDDKEIEGSPNLSIRVVGGRSIDTSQWATPDEGALGNGRHHSFEFPLMARDLLPTKRRRWADATSPYYWVAGQSTAPR